MKTKRLYSSIILSLLAVASMALPAKRITKTVSQPDGSTVELRLCGDEHLHYYTLLSGEPVVKDANGAYCLAESNGRELVSTGLQVNSMSSTKKLGRKLKNTPEDLANLRAARMHDISYPQRVSHTGERKGIVILAAYADCDFTFSRASMDSLMNTVDYRQGYFSGSVHDYFAEQSNGKFSLSFDVVGPVKLSRPMAYYGENSLMGDRHVGEMVAEAIQLADDSVDYSQYDWDGDGTVDQVVVIYAGYGEAMGAAEETIWPQEYTLTKSDFGRKLHLDGVVLDTYACTCELLGNEKSFDGEKIITGIGPMCHEFSHCLGLPDFYDSLDPDHFTTGNWDVMDEGCYNNAEYCPAGYTAYEKWLCGWQEPIVLDKPMTVSDMKALSQGGDFYVVYNDQYSRKTNEFYMLENRQQKGFDYFLPGHGVLITHVNYVASDWLSNSVNATYGKEGYAVVPANNMKEYTDSIQAGQTYPYIDNDSLTDTSTPNAIVFNVNKNFKTVLQKPITKINVDDNGVASFLFMGGGTADGIGVTVYGNRTKSECYDLSGRLVGKGYKGFVIEKQNDGVVKKYFRL